MTESQMIYGTFKEETKNRFLCQVTIDSKDVECYIPSSCRLGNFIDMKGRTVSFEAQSVQRRTNRICSLCRENQKRDYSSESISGEQDY